ncbi:MAG: hypothetical protein DHS20C16_15520 [Phycisphaerae bacterium]|nr:MAG: hypothetical protein DHS20C16_15520 [Phycisphaerae bacterium]
MPTPTKKKTKPTNEDKLRLVKEVEGILDDQKSRSNSETVSQLTPHPLDAALAAPVPDDPDAAAEYVGQMVNILRPNDVKAFKLARRIGQAAKIAKDNRHNRNTKGQVDWETYCVDRWHRSAKTINNFIKFLQIDADEQITMTQALVRLGVKKPKKAPSEYRQQLLAVLSDAQRATLTNSVKVDDCTDQELANVISKMTGIDPNKLPKPTTDKKPSKPKSPSDTPTVDDQEVEPVDDPDDVDDDIDDIDIDDEDSADPVDPRFNPNDSTQKIANDLQRCADMLKGTEAKAGIVERLRYGKDGQDAVSNQDNNATGSQNAYGGMLLTLASIRKSTKPIKAALKTKQDEAQHLVNQLNAAIHDTVDHAIPDAEDNDDNWKGDVDPDHEGDRDWDGDK